MKDTFYVKLGLRIKELRLEKGLSQEKFAEKANIHPKFIGKIERAEKKPSLDTIQKIAASLDVPVYELFILDNV